MSTVSVVEPEQAPGDAGKVVVIPVRTYNIIPELGVMVGVVVGVGVTPQGVRVAVALDPFGGKVGVPPLKM